MQKFKLWLKEWATVAMVAAFALTLAFQAVTNQHTNAVLAKQASNVQPVVCAAVKGSDDAIEAWLKKEVATGPRAADPATTSFTNDLHTALLTAQVKCLTGGK